MGYGPERAADQRAECRTQHSFQIVRAENVVHGSDQQSCSTGPPAVMITDHVPAVLFLLITRVEA